MNYMGLFFIAAGIFSCAAVALDWDWFMNARKARWIVNMAGRTGARIFYGVLGGVLVVLGALELIGIVELSRGR
ncbi:MAG TPA: immunity 17 family protein [Pirellulales bacterium]|nr:immunity 17 family protein [Pirellulales bacterium]